MLLDESGGADADPRMRLRLRPVFVPVAPTGEAEVAVEAAFETVFDPDRPDDERLAAIEDGADLGDVMAQVRERTPRGVGSADVWVDSVRFVAPDEAEVHFAFVLGGGNRFPMVGHAVLVGTEWKVALPTFARVVGTIGVVLPPPPAA